MSSSSSTSLKSFQIIKSNKQEEHSQFNFIKNNNRCDNLDMTKETAGKLEMSSALRSSTPRILIYLFRCYFVSNHLSVVNWITIKNNAIRLRKKTMLSFVSCFWVQTFVSSDNLRNLSNRLTMLIRLKYQFTYAGEGLCGPIVCRSLPQKFSNICTWMLMTPVICPCHTWI